jgi:sirohydrochlorin ferrochelatase
MSEAIILISHGSRVPGAAERLFQLARQLRQETGQIVEAGFLNLAAPTFLDAVERSVAQGASSAVVCPYFLSAGHYVQVSVPACVAQARERHPAMRFRITRPLLFHPLLADLLVANARGGAAPQPGEGLLVLVHGSPLPESHRDMYQVVELIRARGEFALVEVGFMELNEPAIPEAIERCVAQGVRAVRAVPYFLHTGAHVQEDLPELLRAAAARHPDVSFSLGEYIGASPLLGRIILERVKEVPGS